MIDLSRLSSAVGKLVSNNSAPEVSHQVALSHVDESIHKIDMDAIKDAIKDALLSGKAVAHGDRGHDHAQMDQVEIKISVDQHYDLDFCWQKNHMYCKSLLIDNNKRTEDRLASLDSIMEKSYNRNYFFDGSKVLFCYDINHDHLFASMLSYGMAISNEYLVSNSAELCNYVHFTPRCSGFAKMIPSKSFYFSDGSDFKIKIKQEEFIVEKIPHCPECIEIIKSSNPNMNDSSFEINRFIDIVSIGGLNS